MISREKIFDLAKQCGIHYDHGDYPFIGIDTLSNFVVAVCNEVLEEAAELCEGDMCDEAPCGLGRGKEIAAVIRSMKAVTSEGRL